MAAQGDDLRTFIGDFVAALPRIELPLVLKLYPAGLLERRFSGRMDGELSRTLPMRMALVPRTSKTGVTSRRFRSQETKFRVTWFWANEHSPVPQPPAQHQGPQVLDSTARRPMWRNA